MSSDYPELDDPEWLRERYVEEGMSIVEIAGVVGCAQATVNHWLHEHGIDTRTREGAAIQYTDDELLAWIQAWYLEFGCEPRQEDFKGGDVPTPSVQPYRRRFGTFTRARELAMADLREEGDDQ